MGYTFDGSTKVIQLTSGTVLLDVPDMYSRWKDWVQTSDNSKWPVAFTSIGGDDIDLVAGTSIPAYIFLENGWRIRPDEANHTLAVSNGILVVAGGGDPFLNTAGSFVVRILYQQPVQAITVATGGGGDPWATSIEGAYTARDLLRLLAATAYGVSEIDISGPDPIVRFRSLDGSKVRIAGTMDGSERTAVTKDPT